jgi:hypothetical protein
LYAFLTSPICATVKFKHSNDNTSEQVVISSIYMSFLAQAISRTPASPQFKLVDILSPSR